MSNEIYKEKNRNSFPIETKKRIWKYLHFVKISLDEQTNFNLNILNIADVCCGNKFIGESLAPMISWWNNVVDFYDYYPVDETVNFIDLTKPFDSKVKYDVILFIHALEHFKDTNMVLDSLNSMLKEKGKLFIVVPNCEYNKKARDKNIGHEQFFDFNSVKNSIKDKFNIDFIAENNYDKGFEEVWINCSKKVG